VQRLYDVAVIGAGVVGAAIARELSRFAVDTILIEARSDVGSGTSKANTAILHTGFDATPGTLEARLLRRSYPLMLRYAEEAGIAVERTGAVLVAWDEEQRASLPAIQEKAARNGVADLFPLDVEQLYAREPNLGAGAQGALRIPGESIICPYTPPLAFATQAVRNGVELRLSSPLTAVTREAGAHRLACGGETIRARWAINAAGLHSDTVDRMFSHDRFTVTPRRGELIVFDKLARPLLSHVLLPVPTRTTKGVLVSPTVFGNVLLGPTAEDLTDRDETSTTAAGRRFLWEKGGRILPALLGEEVTASYAGLRAATQPGDYQIHLDREAQTVSVGGIRSTGLSAAIGIAEYVVEMLAESGLLLTRKDRFLPVRMPPLGDAQERPFQSASLIGRNPDYGKIVCHCERVSRGELIDAAHAAIPARSLDALRRRTRCLQGRCQGFHCLANVVGLLAAETGQAPEAVLELGAGRP
jgi:glycerol-3-phosphate dehydrogenase